MVSPSLTVSKLNYMGVCELGRSDFFFILTVSGQLPRRTIPHRTGIGPDEWFYSVVVVLVGSCPDGE